MSIRCSRRSTVGQRVAVDLVEAAQVAGRARALRCRSPWRLTILEQIVVRVHAVERGVRGMRLVQVTEQVVDEMGKGFGSNHRFAQSGRSGRAGPPTQIRQWYNKRSPHMPGTLFVVATPIGNLEDITLRALRVLREVAVIAAEDTRRTAHLLARHAITTPTTSLHEHNEAEKSPATDRAARSGATASRSCRTPARRPFPIRGIS